MYELFKVNEIKQILKWYLDFCYNYLREYSRMRIIIEKNVKKRVIFLQVIYNFVYLKFFFNDIVFLIKRNNGDI